MAIDIAQQKIWAMSRLKIWDVNDSLISEIISSWERKAAEWTSKMAMGTSADEIEDFFIEEFRHDPAALVMAIVDNPVTRKRMLEEDYRGTLYFPLPPRSMRKLLTKVDRHDWAAKFFDRLAAKLRRKTLGSARAKKAHPHVDWALFNWFSSVNLLDPTAPPNCLLDNRSLFLASGLMPGMKDSAARTAVSNWKLARPPQSARRPLPQEYIELLSNPLGQST